VGFFIRLECAAENLKLMLEFKNVCCEKDDGRLESASQGCSEAFSGTDVSARSRALVSQEWGLTCFYFEPQHVTQV
jgi:hypothetical protein